MSIGPQDSDEIDFTPSYSYDFDYPGDTSDADDDEGDTLSEVG